MSPQIALTLVAIAANALLVNLSHAQNLAAEIKRKGREAVVREAVIRGPREVKTGQQSAGNWTGSGGNGHALAFVHLGYRLHREMLMEPYESQRVQVRDRLPVEQFLQAVDRTKVVMVEGPLHDRHGDPVTALFLNPEEVRQELVAKGFTSAHAQELIAKDFQLGMIKVDEQRFQNELRNIRVALGTIYHEYLRVMGVGETHYNLSGRTYDAQFMSRLVRELNEGANPLFDRVQASVQPTDFFPTHIFDAIEKEKQRIRAEITEDDRDLRATLAERRPYADQARKAFSEMGNAYADMVGSMGIMPMPFPSYRERVVRSLFESAAKGMEVEEKMSWLEVLNKRIAFLEANLDRNYDFHQQLSQKRQEIYLRALDAETERWFNERGSNPQSRGRQ